MVTRKIICITSPEAAALAATNAFTSTTHAKNNGGNDNENGGGKKRAFPSLSAGKAAKKRQRTDGFVIDLSDVPPQQPIPKSKGWIKEGASKYTGAHFNKSANKWQARIRLEGKPRYIGYYKNEEEAAIDYARAVFKYKGQEALDKEREPKKSKARVQKKSAGISIDLSDVPPQPPIPKIKGRIKEGASKYTGVTFNKKMNK